MQTVEDLLRHRHEGPTIAVIGCWSHPDGMDGRELQDGIWAVRLPRPDRVRPEPDWHVCANPASPG